MRSHQIHCALAHGVNRFEVCQFVSKGVRAIHRSGSRFEDSINDMLQYLGTHDLPPEVIHPAMVQAEAEAEAEAMAQTLTPAA